MADNTVERKKWVEALKCSSNTAIDYKNSLTKKPRNIAKLNKIFDKEGCDKLRERCEEEIKNICSSFSGETRISIDELSKDIYKIEKHLFETIDGCLLTFPQSIEPMKIFVDRFNEQILDEVKSYWSFHHKQMNV